MNVLQSIDVGIYLFAVVAGLLAGLGVGVGVIIVAFAAALRFIDWIEDRNK